jgi:tRNA pseudouridine55 synthase
MNGLLLINKGAGYSSFGAIEQLQQVFWKQGLRKKDQPKMGHGGTLDPFATGLLPVCVGRAVKLARYFLGSDKVYEGVIRFGETTAPGDPTAPVIETSEVIPDSITALRELARGLTRQDYLQTPPMYSAKKKDGKPLYELAREGIEVEREAKLCRLYDFEIIEYQAPRASFRLKCSTGTYVRTLAQDFGKMLGSVALLETLHRTETGGFSIATAMTIPQILAAGENGQTWDQLPAWIPFDRMLEHYPQIEATDDERQALLFGQQGILISLVQRYRKTSPVECEFLVITHQAQLLAVARRSSATWEIERVFGASEQ